MLHKETVESGTLELLKQLQKEPLLAAQSIPDIIAMKLSAIAQNGTRIKDFIDIATLSCRYSLEEMLQFYTAKFPNANVMMPTKSLTYFAEIDFNESVVMTIGEFTWAKVADRLIQMVKNPQKKFLTAVW